MRRRESDQQIEPGPCNGKPACPQAERPRVFIEELSERSLGLGPMRNTPADGIKRDHRREQGVTRLDIRRRHRVTRSAWLRSFPSERL